MRSFLSRHDVERVTTLARSTIYKFIDEGTFPKPIRISGRRVAWVESEIQAWIDDRIANSSRKVAEP